jgi:1,2-dihydroxy-3-keto-5-methylthiopentene dioxygenase
MKATWLDSGETISPALLAEHGVTSERLSTDEAVYRGALERIMAARGYVTMDTVTMKPDMPNFEAICQKFVGEHLHTEDEVRFILSGAGVFDIRSRDDRWMHVVVEPGDFILVPAERYHRFSLGEEKHIQAVRLFKDMSGWTPHYRTLSATSQSGQ